MYKVPVNYHTKFRFVTAIYMSTYAHTHTGATPNQNIYAFK